MPATLLAEALESRLFMSVSDSAVFDSTVRLDRLQVRVDLLKFRTDSLSTSITMLSDVTAIKRDDPGQATTIVPLVKKFKSDLAQMRVALLNDRLAEAKSVLADKIAIVGALKKLLTDAGDPTVQAADRAQLHAARLQLQDDLVAGLTARIATRQAASDTIFNDGQAIIDAVQTDPDASPKLQADVQKWVVDREARMTLLSADLEKLLADRTKLAADLGAAAAAA